MDGSSPDRRAIPEFNLSTEDSPAIQVPFGGSRSPTASFSLSQSASPTMMSPTLGSPRIPSVQMSTPGTVTRLGEGGPGTFRYMFFNE